MKIAYILPKLSNQGPIIVVKDIIDEIKSKVDLIDVYYFDDVVELDFNCNVYKINFFQKIDFNKYDVIHTHMLRPDLYVWYHRKKSSAKYVTTLHQNIYDNLKGNYNVIIAYFFEKIWLYILKKHDTVVVLTNIMKSLYEKKISKQFKTIYNGRNFNVKSKPDFNQADLGKINNFKKKYKIIGSHCLLTKRKGIKQILYSLELLEDYAMVIVGDGQELENLKKIAIKKNVIDRCLFIGYRNNAVDYLKYFDIYVMCSYSEGFPLGLLEAGMSRLPIVCSDIPIFRELFSEEEVCFFELDKIQKLANAVKLCYTKKNQLSSKIYTSITEKYSVNSMAEKYLELYKM